MQTVEVKAPRRGAAVRFVPSTVVKETKAPPTPVQGKCESFFASPNQKLNDKEIDMLLSLLFYFILFFHIFCFFYLAVNFSDFKID